MYLSIYLSIYLFALTLFTPFLEEVVFNRVLAYKGIFESGSLSVDLEEVFKGRGCGRHGEWHGF